MKFSPTGLEGLLTLTPVVHKDHRGFFLETFREEAFAAEKISFRPAQDNHARSEAAGVVRGMHFQAPPHDQTKLIWAIRGSIFDVAVDIRLGSPTYGRWFGCVLSADNFQRLFVPKGFAHGYMTLEPGSEVCYKVDNYYCPQAEGGLRWNDLALNIEWPDPGLPPTVAERDQNWPALAKFISPFKYNGK